MVNTEIRLIIFLAGKDGEAVYSQQKQDQELTVAQIMNSLLPNSDLIEESKENHWTIQVWPKSNPLQLYSRSDKQIQGLDLADKSAWRTMDGGLWHCIGGSDQDHPQEKGKQKKAK